MQHSGVEAERTRRRRTNDLGASGGQRLDEVTGDDRFVFDGEDPCPRQPTCGHAQLHCPWQVVESGSRRLLVMKDCNNLDAEQRWHFAGLIRVDGKCLDLIGASNDAAPLGTAACTPFGVTNDKFDYYW